MYSAARLIALSAKSHFQIARPVVALIKACAALQSPLTHSGPAVFDARPGAAGTVREAERKSGRIKARLLKRDLLKRLIEYL